MRLEPADPHSPLVVPEDGWGLGRGYQLLEQSRRFLALREWSAFDAKGDTRNQALTVSERPTAAIQGSLLVHEIKGRFWPAAGIR